MKVRQGRILAYVFISIGLMMVAACGSATTETLAAPTTAPAATGERSADLQWSSPPAMEIDPSQSYEAVLMTEIGDIRVRLFADQAPMTVNNFVFLAKQGYYDNTTFHRVLPGLWPRAAIRPEQGEEGRATRFGTNSTRIFSLTGKVCWRWPTAGQIPTAGSSLSRIHQLRTSTGFTPYLARLLEAPKF